METVLNKVMHIAFPIICNVENNIRKKRDTDSKCIVLIADRMKPRVSKIGYALRKKNNRVVLLLEAEHKDDIFHTELKCFDKIFFFKDKEEAFVKCLWFKPLVYHIFSEADIKDWTEYLIKRKKILGKIVYDQYDVYRGFYRQHSYEIAKREKYCFENADGICCRSFETQYLKHRFNYKFKGKRILFFDYCWNTYHFKRKRTRTDSLNLVYGGLIQPPASKDILGETEWEAICFLADAMQKSGNYFTVIPSSIQNEWKYREFYILEKINSNFILEKPMSFRKLIEYESGMDYGIDCLEFQNRMQEYQVYLKKNIDYTAKAKYYATNKFFDYLDAGIPIIYGRKGEMFGRFLAYYGVALPCALEDMPDKIEELKKKRNECLEKIANAKKELSVQNQITRLIEFYENI